MQIVDNQDMTISVWVFPKDDISQASLELLAAIKQGYLTVKAAGVWAGDIQPLQFKPRPWGVGFSASTWTTNTSPGLTTAHGRKLFNGYK